MRAALAVILFGHGFAHLVGFVVPWRIATLKEMPYKTSVLADSVNVGDLGIQVVGILRVLTQTHWWLPVTMIVAVFSFLLCIVGWPESRIGVFVNMAIVAFLLVDRRTAWLP